MKQEELKLETRVLDEKKLQNEGTMVVLTSFNSEEERKSLESEIVDMVKGRNMIVNNLGNVDSFAKIDRLNCFIINIQPVDTAGLLPNLPLQKSADSEIVHFHHHACVALGPDVLAAVHGATLDIYGLVSMTLSGIPMKEEHTQTASSVTYDVELFHPKEALETLNKHKLLEPGSHLVVTKGAYQTVKLAWATPMPKVKWNMFPRISTAVRLSPATFNSRQSVCLTSFLMAGKNVLLEISRQGEAEKLPVNVNQKLISHALMAHCGRLYLHSVHIGLDPVLDDKELIESAAIDPSDGLRVDDFKTLMKECSLSLENPPSLDSAPLPLSETLIQPRTQLRRLTRFWPVHKDKTLLYNISAQHAKFLEIMSKPELNTEDGAQARASILEIVANKDKAGLLLAASKAQNIKSIAKNPGSKAEQYSVFCQELALHLGNYVNNSERHLELFTLFVQLTGVERTLAVPTDDINLNGKRSCLTSIAEAVKVFGGGGSGHSTRPSSPSNSPQPKRTRKDAGKYSWKPGETINLYSWLCEQEQAKRWTNWQDFEGRKEAGDQPARLYPGLDLTSAPKRGEQQ
ncbi:unnamed protein product, partial [Mesorhabditis spiculigera]